MNIRELIDELEQIAEEHGDDTEVRYASQPAWPFEYSIARVISTDDDPEGDWGDGGGPRRADDEDDDEGDGETTPKGAVIAYLSEGTQLGYLPTAVKNQLGWGR